MRFFLEISYKGDKYHGWQVQPNANTVQAEINNALSTVLNKNVKIVGAGRTDSGVHAKQMFAHFDFENKFSLENLPTKLNSFLPNDIAIHSVFKVKNDANCRFDALSRTYHYHISYKKNPFFLSSYLLHKRLDVFLMNSACTYLIGSKDFTSFSKVNTQTFTNNCNIMFAKWEENKDGLMFSIKANRFLRNMVRAIVGTLIDVGKGKIKPDCVKTIIEAKSRCKAGNSVPAHALFLVNIEYQNELNNLN